MLDHPFELHRLYLRSIPVLLFNWKLFLTNCNPLFMGNI